jgi:sensor histidine kinase YesM
MTGHSLSPSLLRSALWVVAVGPIAFCVLLYAAVGESASWAETGRNVAITYFHFAGYAAGFYLPEPLFRRVPGPRDWPRWLFRFVTASLLGSTFALGVCVFLGWKGRAESLSDLPRSLGVGMTVMLICLFMERLYRQLLDSRSEATQKAIEEEKALRLAAEAQWNSLESRVRPHFLFNTLSSIRELVHQDPEQAELMIERFSDLLRSSLDAPRRSTARLSEEIEVVGNYLEIERMRLGARLEWRVDCEEQVLNCKVPSLSVLTLVENSVKHAIAPARDGGVIEVTALRDRGELVLRVRDDGPGFTLDQCPPGHGIDLLQRRLESAFGGTASLTVEAAGGVTVRCPFLAGPIVSRGRA